MRGGSICKGMESKGTCVLGVIGELVWDMKILGVFKEEGCF